MKFERILVVTVLIAVLSPFQSSSAGIVVTKDGRAKVGEVKRYKSGRVLVSFKIGKTAGKMTYKAAQVLWLHRSPKIKSLYDGARAAYAKKEFKIAKLLIGLSLKDPREADTHAKAKELLRFVQEIGKKSRKNRGDDDNGEKPVATKRTEGGDTARVAKSSDKTEVTVTDEMLEKNKIFKAVKGNATYYNGTAIADFNSKKYAAAEYYVIIFASLAYAEVRDSVRRMKKHYGDMKSDYGHTVEFLLVSVDDKKEVWDSQYPKLQVPFPAMKFEKSKTISFGAGNLAFRVVVVDAAGTVVARGQREFDAIQTLREKLDEDEEEED